MFRDDGKQEIWEELRIRENGRGVTNHKQEGGRRGARAEMKGVSPWEKSSSPENLSL